MKLDYAFLAEAAIMAGNKLNVLGMDVSRLKLSDFPGFTPPLYLVAKFLFEEGEGGQEYPVALACIGPEGEELFRAEARVAPPKPSAERKMAAVMVFGPIGFEVQKPGKHLAKILVTGEEMKTISLTIVDASQDTAPAE